ncbi:hypothetical protein BDQ12DRAFT_630883 [Crucibulum laeve]|uniref:SigF-like NTF2-like domain-containing protein n=1 Tax=Crucibulum laeve TaxID=68775 RepID=A0A5C3M0W2_9AGAR|nr:hypothetical protein BDQ12DRAFT_630883 [Crucibulum laeve]
MQNPAKEITSVVLQLTATSSPDVQKATIERYMTSDVGFRHPVCSITPGPNSRDGLLGIYQWYRVLSPKIDIKVESIVFDAEKCVIYLEAVQWFRLFFLPIRPAPSRLVIRLTLRKENELYYISLQEDFYHTDDFMALLLPPAVPFVRLGLSIAGFTSDVLAKSAQVLGFWRPTGNVAAHPDDADVGLYDSRKSA